MKQKLTENSFVQYISFIVTAIKIKAIAANANEDSEKSFIYLNTYRLWEKKTYKQKKALTQGSKNPKLWMFS